MNPLRPLAVALLLALPALAGPSADDISAAVEGLASPEAAVREESRKTILKWAESDPEGIDKALPETSDDLEATAALKEIHKSIRAMVSIRHREERVMAACGNDEVLKEATKGLLARLSDPEFLAPADDSPVRLPETDGELTPFVTGTYRSGKPGVCRVMEALLVDGSLGVRRIAARILYYHGGPANEKALVVSMKDDDPYIRGCGALTLSHYGVKSAEAAIRELQKDPDPQVQQHATMALDELAKVMEPEQLRKLLKSDNLMDRKTAVAAIVEKHDPAWLKDLAPLLEDRDPDIRDAVVAAMQNDGGFTFDETQARLEAARRWWAERKDKSPAEQPPRGPDEK